MRTVVCFVLLVPILALAAGTTQPLTALPSEDGAVSTAPAAPATVAQGRQSTPLKALVGAIDTVGGTTYDWWANGPIYRMIVNSPGHGVHVTWMHATELNGQDFPSRLQYYNYHDYTTRSWAWKGSNYMDDDGVGVFPTRTGYGNIDADTTGAAVISAHWKHGDGHLWPWVARDVGPGAGIFEYCDSMVFGAMFQWPPLAVGGDGTIHLFPIESTYVLEYSRGRPDTWPHFTTPVFGFDPSPGFSTHNITASKVSQKVALTWVVTGSAIEPGYADFSTDGGVTWGGPTLLDPPACFTGDSVASFGITSIFPWYDRQDRFHIVADLAPVVNDTEHYIISSQIWHYCPDNTPNWSHIQRYGIDTSAWVLHSGVGYNATVACRPSIGQDDEGNLFVTWEQFDSLNYDPTTNRLRADIFASRSTNNGLTWGPATRLTDAGTCSMRFPSVIDLAVEGDPDTILVVYEADSVAGFYVAPSGASPEGPAAQNPTIVQRLPVTDLPPPGIEEQPSATPVRLEAAVQPNPFGASTRVSYALPRTGNVSLVVYDAVGRPVQTLVSGRRAAGRYTATWNASGSAAGVYFCTLESEGSSVTHKIVLTD